MERWEFLSHSLFLSPPFQSANPSGRRSVVPLTESTVFLLSMKVGNFSPVLFSFSSAANCKTFWRKYVVPVTESAFIFLWTKVEYFFLSAFTNNKSFSKQLSCPVNLSRVSFRQPISFHHGHWPDVLFSGGRWQGAQEGNKELSTSSFTCTSRPPSLRQTDLHLVNLLWRYSNISGPISARKNHHHHQNNNKAMRTVRRQKTLWIRSIMDQKSGCTGRDQSRSSLRALATEICDRNM